MDKAFNSVSETWIIFKCWLDLHILFPLKIINRRYAKEIEYIVKGVQFLMILGLFVILLFSNLPLSEHYMRFIATFALILGIIKTLK